MAAVGGDSMADDERGVVPVALCTDVLEVVFTDLLTTPGGGVKDVTRYGPASGASARALAHASARAQSLKRSSPKALKARVLATCLPALRRCAPQPQGRVHRVCRRG